jgi:hypothetical protein
MVNKFKANLYAEFERNCFHIFGLPGARIREILSVPDDLYEMYEEAWDFGGARFMRQTMAFTILTLEKIYYEDEIGRLLSDEETAERFESFNIGMDAEGIDEWNEKRVKQLDAKGHYDDAKKYIRTYR